MLILCNARGQDLGDDRVRDSREPVGYGPCGRRVLQIIDLPQRQDEGEHAVLVVKQDPSPLTGILTSERERGAGGETQGINSGDGVFSEGHNVRIVSHLHPFFLELIDDRAPIHVAAEEGEDIPSLELPYDGDGGLIAASLAHNSGESRHTTVNQLDAPGAKLDVIDGAVEMTITGEIRVIRAPRQLKSRIRLWLFAVYETDTFDCLCSQKGGHPAVEGLPQIRHPQILIRYRMQELLRVLKHRFQIAQCLDFVSQHAVGHRQVVRGVRELDRCVRSLFGNRLLQQRVSLGDQAVRAANGSCCDIS